MLKIEGLSIHMRQGVGLRQRTSLGLKVDPRVLLGSQLLELSAIELDAAIESELEENPALERLFDERQEITDEAILKSLSPRDLALRREDYEAERSFTSTPPDDHVDWLEFASRELPLAEHLTAQLLPRLDAHRRQIGEFLIGSLDERGYLETSVEEVALACNASLDEVDQVLRSLQECEPCGIGARSVQECLLLQLSGEHRLEAKVAQAMLTRCWDEFLARDRRAIMRKLRIVGELLDAAIEVVLGLDPYPGQQFVGGSRSASVRPDLVLTCNEAGWSIEVPGAGTHSLAVSRAYRERLRKLDRRGRGLRDERRHLADAVDRAERFLGALEQRRRTMVAIGGYLIERQAGFLQTGEGRFLNPLTRSQMAQDLGLHESTVSRATADKFVQIPTGEVIAFEMFFRPALRVQKMIEEILATENPSAPLSDERIAKMLAERGVQVARRTVNKYRDRTKLLSSRRRRSA